MQVVNIKTTKKFEKYITVVSEHKFYFILLLFLIFGMFVGALSVRLLDGDYSIFIKQWFGSFIEFRTSFGFWKILFNSFLISLIYLIIISVSGFGVGGMVIMPLLVFFKGFGTCLLSGVLYRDYSLHGIAFADLILLPSALAANLMLVYLSESAMELSKRFYNCINDSNYTNHLLKAECLSYFKRLMYVLFAFVVISVIESAFNSCFIGYFNF